MSRLTHTRRRPAVPGDAVRDESDRIMAGSETEIKAGDRVRAREGAYKGLVGEARRVVTTRDQELASVNVLVIFPGGADYLSVDALEKAEE